MSDVQEITRVEQQFLTAIKNLFSDFEGLECNILCSSLCPITETIDKIGNIGKDFFRLIESQAPYEYNFNLLINNTKLFINEYLKKLILEPKLTKQEKLLVMPTLKLQVIEDIMLIVGKAIKSSNLLLSNKSILIEGMRKIREGIAKKTKIVLAINHNEYLAECIRDIGQAITKISNRNFRRIVR